MTVHFAATNFVLGVKSITPDLVMSNETNDEMVMGVAVDRAGNSNSTVVFVSIDKTHPSVKLLAGNEGILDKSYPLLVIDYSDEGSGGASAQPSGLDMDSFQTTLDGVPSTNLFYRFDKRAFAIVEHLSEGPHVWVATIGDLAGNFTTVSNIFTATGAVNTNAPTIRDTDLTDDVTLVPDWPELWVQGKVSGKRSLVSAFVNDGEWFRMNRTKDIFGFLVPLDYGTNLIVLAASDSEGQNRHARLFKAVRSDKFELKLTSPAFKFGKFCNGKAQVTEGSVSYRLANDSSNAMTLTSVRVNGMSASVSGVAPDGLVKWHGVILPSPGCTNPVVPIIVSVCWTGQSASGDPTNLCINVPVDFLEAFEIVERKTSHAEFWLNGMYPNQAFEQGAACGRDQWVLCDYSFEWSEDFTLACPVEKNSTFVLFESPWPWTWSCSDQESIADETISSQDPVEIQTDSLVQPERWLAFGSWSWRAKYTRHETGDELLFLDELQVVDDGSLTFRTPFHMGSQYANIFTFIGVEGVVLTNLTFMGHSPVGYDEANRSVYYLFTLDGGTEYTITQASFSWLASSTTWFTQYGENESSEGNRSQWHSEEFHSFRFSDFDQ